MWGYMGPMGNTIGYFIGGLSTTVTSLGLLLGGLLGHAPGCGPMAVTGGALSVVGFGLLGAAGYCYRRAKALPHSGVKMAPEGQAIISRLGYHIGWVDWSKSGFGFLWQRRRTSEQVLSADVFEVLNAAAEQYNRIMGVIESAGLADDKQLKKHELAVRAAADEAITVVFNQAGLLDRFPESSAKCKATTNAKIAELRELADIVERISSNVSLAEVPEEETIMRNVLSNLKIHEQAQNELTEASEELRLSDR